jgi:hypothetical protein
MRPDIAFDPNHVLGLAIGGRALNVWGTPRPREPLITPKGVLCVGVLL